VPGVVPSRRYVRWGGSADHDVEPAGIDDDATHFGSQIWPIEMPAKDSPHAAVWKGAILPMLGRNSSGPTSIDDY
jgi:hypothetical protein